MFQKSFPSAASVNCNSGWTDSVRSISAVGERKNYTQENILKKVCFKRRVEERMSDRW